MPYVEDGGGTNRNHEDADHKYALGCKASRSEARIAEPSVGRRDPLKGLETPKKESEVARVSNRNRVLIYSSER
jgi:hypothetical protein